MSEINYMAFLKKANMIDTYTDDFEERNEEPLTEEKIKTEFTCFTVEGNDFFPSKRTTNFIPNGYYKIRKDYSRGIFLRKQKINLSKLVVLENCPIHKTLISEIERFWESKKEYQKRSKVYKKNILLHSAPGMGKTSLINLVIDDLINNRDGMVITISEANDIFNFNDAMMYIRAMMPERPIIAIIEDFDNFGGDGSTNAELETELLNILDGNQKHDNLVIIATTNYPDKLHERYINRPSRFNLILEYEYPDEDLRREFLTKINLPEDIEKIDLEDWVKKTEGYTTDYLNELSMAVFINGQDVEQTFIDLNKMRNTKKVKYKKPNEKSIGFNN